MVAVEKRYGECTPRNLGPGSGFAHSRSGQQYPRTEKGSKGERTMKRMIAGVLLLIGLGAGTMFAEDSYRRVSDIRPAESLTFPGPSARPREFYDGDYLSAPPA